MRTSQPSSRSTATAGVLDEDTLGPPKGSDPDMDESRPTELQGAGLFFGLDWCSDARLARDAHAI